MKKYFIKFMVKFLKFYLLLLAALRSFVTVLENILDLLPVLKRKITENISYNHKVEIYVERNFSLLIRDVLITLNSLYKKLLYSNGVIGVLRVYINDGIQFNNIDNVYSCLTMNSLVKNIRFDWLSSNTHNNNEVSSLHVDNYYGSCTGRYMSVFIDGKRESTQDIDDYFLTSNSNFLEVPHSIRVWARGVLKACAPGLFIVSFHISDLDIQKGKIQPRELQDFFMNIWHDFPDIYIFHLESPLDSNNKSYFNMPNVADTRLLGYNFLEQFALTQVSDLFVGSCDKYAAAVIGSGKPYFLFGTNGSDLSGVEKPIVGDTRILSRSDYQKWIQKDISPINFYPEFRDFYVRLHNFLDMQ